MEGADIIESPRKRLKTDNTPTTDDVLLPPSNVPVAETDIISDSDAQALKEVEVGITEFVSAGNEGFSGILKKRYTDFLVNEILPSGEVLHLRNTSAPKSATEEKKKSDANSETPTQDNQKVESGPSTEKDATPSTEDTKFELSEEDNALLESFFGSESTQKIVALHNRALSSPKARPNELGKVTTIIVSDRDLRIKIHQAIRRIFNSQLESTTDSEGMMSITAAPNRNKRHPEGGRGGGRERGRLNFDELGGSYLHFTIYKENKDTMEVISFLARQMKMAPKAFQFAGTKDRRGVTAQRACVSRVFADRLAKLNNTLRNAALGDYEYCKHGLELGDLMGNEFVVTLRECDIPGVDLQDREAAVTKAKELVGSALRDLRERGYFNYYGLQRFGTFATRTDSVGVKMLQGDFKGACDAILHYNPHVLAAAQEDENSTSMISSDDKARAQAIHIFQTTGRVMDAIEKLPRKFSAENNLIRHLGRSKNDYLGALQGIPRNLRLMYVHAYQSLVWNFAVGERWKLYGDKVVEGDLVLIHEHREKTDSDIVGGEVIDADGEVIIAPQADDSAYAAEDMFERARALTAEEAASGKYTIFDIVLPLPGFDVVYPPNEMTEFYKRFMGSEQGGGLDPFDMRRQWRDISLSGGYRKVLSRMGEDYSVDVKLYSQDDEQFVPTDMDILKNREVASAVDPESKNKIAVILKFQLGTSQYATMALRELMKGKVVAYKPDFGGGR